MLILTMAFFRLSCIGKYSGQIRLIGPCNKGWLVRIDDSYSLILPWKIRETLKLHHLLCEHVFHTKVLEQPLRIDKDSLGSKAWNYFNDLLTNDPCSLEVVLSKNGFKVDSANGMII